MKTKKRTFEMWVGRDMTPNFYTLNPSRKSARGNWYGNNALDVCVELWEKFTGIKIKPGTRKRLRFTVEEVKPKKRAGK